MPSNIKGSGSPKEANGNARLAANRQDKIPEFTSIPSARTVEFYSGLKRGVINGLVLPCAANNYMPPVKSVNLRRPGSIKGKRLVVLQGVFGRQFGLLTYLRNLALEETDVGHRQSSGKSRSKTRRASGKTNGD